MGDSSVGELSAEDIRMNLSNNLVVNCSVHQVSSSIASGVNSIGNVYGGAFSVNIGHYCFAGDGTSVVGSTVVRNTFLTTSGNTLINCSALIATTGDGVFSNGANVYGGGISLQLGAYSYSGGSSKVSGSTALSSSVHNITDNTLINCSALSSTVGAPSSFSNGANVFGGGVSLQIGAYSYSSNSSIVYGSTAVSDTSNIIAGNALSSCKSLTTMFGGASNGASAFGGGI